MIGSIRGLLVRREQKWQKTCSAAETPFFLIRPRLHHQRVRLHWYSLFMMTRSLCFFEPPKERKTFASAPAYTLPRNKATLFGGPWRSSDFQAKIQKFLSSTPSGDSQPRLASFNGSDDRKTQEKASENGTCALLS